MKALKRRLELKAYLDERLARPSTLRYRTRKSPSPPLFW